MSGYYVKIYVDSFSLSFLPRLDFHHGHAFMELIDASGHSEVYGFYPSTKPEDIIWGIPGELKGSASI